MTVPRHEELFSLANEVAVVTGAGRGIGEGIAHRLAQADAAVVCAARRSNEVERVAADIRAGKFAVKVDDDQPKSTAK